MTLALVPSAMLPDTLCKQESTKKRFSGKSSCQGVNLDNLINPGKHHPISYLLWLICLSKSPVTSNWLCELGGSHRRFDATNIGQITLKSELWTPFTQCIRHILSWQVMGEGEDCASVHWSYLFQHRFIHLRKNLLSTWEGHEPRHFRNSRRTISPKAGL